MQQRVHDFIAIGLGPFNLGLACLTDPIEALDGLFLEHKAELQRQSAITLIGSGQSAAEIYHDLLADIDRFGYWLDWITRSPRFFPLEYGKLILEMTSPDYIDYFHALPEATRNTLMQHQKSLYKGINLELIDAIYEQRYAKELTGEVRSELLTNTCLETCRHDAERGEYELTLWQSEQRRHFRHRTPALIMATSYRYHMPDFLAPITSRIAFDDAGRYAVSRFYDIDGGRGEILVQNAELHTHSLVAPDLGMGLYRNACIIRAMTGKEVYPIEERIAYQRLAPTKRCWPAYGRRARCATSRSIPSSPRSSLATTSSLRSSPAPA
ncbi:MAG: SidA/IucD/PvdA family monooxygenase [Halomonas sp.]